MLAYTPPLICTLRRFWMWCGTSLPVLRNTHFPPLGLDAVSNTQKATKAPRQWGQKWVWSISFSLEEWRRYPRQSLLPRCASPNTGEGQCKVAPPSVATVPSDQSSTRFRRMSPKHSKRTAQTNIPESASPFHCTQHPFAISFHAATFECDLATPAKCSLNS